MSLNKFSVLAFIETTVPTVPNSIVSFELKSKRETPKKSVIENRIKKLAQGKEGDFIRILGYQVTDLPDDWGKEESVKNDESELKEIKE